jgi:hypothetical protein
LEGVEACAAMLRYQRPFKLLQGFIVACLAFTDD